TLSISLACIRALITSDSHISISFASFFFSALTITQLHTLSLHDALPILVYDTDKEELKKKTRELRSHFEGHQMRLEVPPGDQRTLFYQSFPGAEITVKDWVQRSNTNALAASMPWLETVVGSDIEDQPALYQGYTVIADGKEVKHGTPMFFDLASVADEEGRAPTEFVCGDPGSGKTVSR